jgi:hypothetical protein
MRPLSLNPSLWFGAAQYTIFSNAEMPSTHLNPGLKSLAAYDSYNIFSNTLIFFCLLCAIIPMEIYEIYHRYLDIVVKGAQV